MPTLLDAGYNLTRSAVWKPVGEKRADGFQPCIKRVYRLPHTPTVLGELSFSHFIQRGTIALYLFSPLWADQSHMTQLVELKNVEEVTE